MSAHLVDQEGQETSGDDRVADPDVVARPGSLEPVEVGEIGRAVQRELSFGRVEGLKVGSEGGEVLVQHLHGGLANRRGHGGECLRGNVRGVIGVGKKECCSVGVDQTLTIV